jgi:membrane-associated HD superfamily phosphohydrolase
VATFFQIAEFKHPFCKNFYLPAFSSFPLVLIGQSAVTKFGESSMVSLALDFLLRIASISQSVNFHLLRAFDFSLFSILNTYSARIHALEAGFQSNLSKTFTTNSLDLKVRTKYVAGTTIFYSLGFDHLAFKDMISASSASDSL